MSTKRIKIPAALPPLPNREAAERVAGHVTLNILKERALQVRMDKQLAEVKQDYEKEFARLAKERAPMVEQLRAWADANKPAFEGKRSLDMLHAVIGWRTGQHQPKTLKGWTWPKVVAACKKLRHANWVRVKEEPNKERMVEDRALSMALAEVGVRIIQDETFFVDPKVDEDPARQAAPAEKARAA